MQKPSTPSIAQRGTLRLTLLIAACATFLLGSLAASASAEVTYERSFGSNGSGAGQFSRAGSISIDRATGDLYVIDAGNNRIEQFTEGGQFIRAWGYDVVESGTDNKPPANEQQQIVVRGDSGTFQLRFLNQTTHAIPFDATPTEVEEAFDELPIMEATGSSVSVTGGPGDAAGSSPYVITFDGGPLAGNNLPQVEIVEAGLGLPAGTQLTCSGHTEREGGFFPPPTSESWEYQWLANGVPIPGATSPTYTPSGSDAGKAIQCQVTATWFHTHASMTNRNFRIASPAGTPVPPQIQEGIFFALSSNATLQVGSSGGQVLTCQSGEWSGSPTSYTYRFFVNGQEVGSPTTTSATQATYTVTEADLADRGAFQCSIKATNAGGSSTTFSNIRSTEPEPEPRPSTPISLVESPSVSQTATLREGGAVFEVCEANPPSNDVCKEGVGGPGLGQFSFEAYSGPPEGIAVDNSPAGAGDVYVVDPGNARVQKFSATGEPILEFGGQVNKTTGANLCTVASGDACGGGVPDVERFATHPSTYASGVFGGWEPLFQEEELGDEVAVDDAGFVYVGDLQQGSQPFPSRIQKFDSGGNYVAQVAIPSKAPNPGFFVQPISVEVDAQQRAYASLSTEDSAIEEFQPTQFGPNPGGPRFADRNVFDSKNKPIQLAVDPDTQYIWTSDANPLTIQGQTHVCGETGTPRRALMAFDYEGHELECATPLGEGLLPEVTGLAISDSGLAFASVGWHGVVKVFKLPQPKAPTVESESVNGITTESAKLHATINPGFAPTHYTFEYGTSDCSAGGCQKAPTETAYGNFPVDVTTSIVGLQDHTRYHYRVVIENSEGTDVGPDQTFATYASTDLLNDPCPNALARKQTKTAALDDCRAYELASAEWTGGYDVESDLVPGERPFPLYPHADGKVLYAVHDGGIPGTGNPTNRGPDPYVAVRNAAAQRWDTRYVGIPADASPGPFSSTLAEGDQALDTFAFAGDEICSPCFPDGSSGIPIHLADGSLVQGLKGSIPSPGAEPAGYVGRYLSSDGTRLVFGTTAKLEPNAAENGDVKIYERNLAAGVTELVSTMTNGSPITGADAGELGMSDDGSRVVVGSEVSQDGAGNTYWHPYMHFAGNSQSTDLAPNTTSGVLFDGMTADGSKVFYTTTDKLLPTDTDGSADIYEAAVGSAGNVTLRLVSVGPSGPSNSNACGPNSWNAVSGDGMCGAVAIGGGAGVAAADGTIYFLSPERLDGASGTADQPNLYVEPAGGSPTFVTTLEPGNPLVTHAVSESWVRYWSDFVTGSNGAFAAFATTEPLQPEYDNAGFTEVYRYSAASGHLDCTSCDPTEAKPHSDASLPSHGLGMTDDGRVFFNTPDQLVLRDTNENEDGYEWEDGIAQLVSSGTSIFDSGLLGVTADGKDAFFFTREKLVAKDLNGEAMKLYDAREEGGFFEVPQQPPCAASDECHGPSSQAAPPPQIGTFKGSGGQFKAPAPGKCRRGFVRRHGKCVRKGHHKRRRHHKRHHRHHKRHAKNSGGTQR